MQMTREYDLLSGEIAGKNLIEASAGTGKTFTITGLFLRLLLEKGLTVDQILVVTFTEAATNELRSRIRDTLLTAKAMLAGGKTSEPFLSQYFSHRLHEKDQDVIESAIRDFDEASIYTIHRFCSRILREYAFESRGLFDTELIIEQSDLLFQIVEDFWRRNLYHESPLFVCYATGQINPKSLFELLLEQVGQPYLRVIPKAVMTDCSSLETRFEASFRQVQNEWMRASEEIRNLLMTSSALSRNSYSTKRIPGWLAGIESYAALRKASPTLPQKFERLTTESLERGVKKGCIPPQHPFFAICQDHLANYKDLESVYRQRVIALKSMLFEYANSELRKRKQDKNVFFFDDLIFNLNEALKKSGEDLPRTIRSRFRAALIDEFQDTDPIQYEIFMRVFDHPDSTLFVIGDPKQSIYGFRGADVFAYMQAKQRIENQYTLSRNYRSNPDLIKAINALFSGNSNPFIFEGIPFVPATPSDLDNIEKLTMDGALGDAFKLWFVEAGLYSESGKALYTDNAKEIITNALSAEIVQLLELGLDNRMMIGDRPVREKDIAVLVRSNFEARQVQTALTEVNVHSVLYSSDNLFKSREPAEFERILYAVSEPQRTRFLKAALSTEIMGVTGEEIFEMECDDSGLEVWFDRFHQYNRTWQEHGFMSMFKKMVHDENILTRLMIYPDGERRLTNLLHIAELLNQVSVEQRLGMTGLLKWLHEQRVSGAPVVEAHQLRLESDENAVKIVTMHMSKGLEYPVVFCPFAWGASYIRKPEQFKFHDEDNEQRLTLELGSESVDLHKVQALKEELAENLRLLYVAVTRARNRCYLVWGRFYKAETSAPAYLFHQQKTIATDDIVQSLGNYVKVLDDGDLRKDLNRIKALGEGTIDLTGPPKLSANFQSRHLDDQFELFCREFMGRIDNWERISSYSSLVSRVPHAAEVGDYDAIEVSKREEEVEGDNTEVPEYSEFLTFPRGAKTGIFVHDVLENIDFTKILDEETSGLLSDKLKAFGFVGEWQDAIRKMLVRLCSANLGIDGNSLKLRDVKSVNRLNELEFYFSMDALSSKGLKNAFDNTNDWGTSRDLYDGLEELSFSQMRGFMKGFIDLVFESGSRYYIIDWKSNYLGGEPQDYDQTSLLNAMTENLYTLQYHIYTIALDRYLRLRKSGYDYDTHFGGVFYVFLRGLGDDPEHHGGIYHARPPAGLVKALSQAMGSGLNQDKRI